MATERPVEDSRVGWFADPTGHYSVRYRGVDGWTAWVANGAGPFVDPRTMSPKIDAPVLAPPSVAPEWNPLDPPRSAAAAWLAIVVAAVAGMVMAIATVLPWVTFVFVDAGRERFNGFSLVRDAGDMYQASGATRWFWGTANQVTWNWGLHVAGPGVPITCGCILIVIASVVAFGWSRAGFRGDASRFRLLLLGTAVGLVSFFSSLGNSAALGVGASAHPGSGIYVWMLASAVSIAALIYLSFRVAQRRPWVEQRRRAWGAITLGVLAVPFSVYSLVLVPPLLGIAAAVVSWAAVLRKAPLARAALVLSGVALLLAVLFTAAGGSQ